jgi:dipeptidyl aminopeptidase/acylaminoacyl peptidase
MPIDGGERTKLTSMTGGTTREASPDDRTFGLIYSSSTKPNEVYVMPNRAGATATQVTTSTSEEWRSFKWIEPQLVTDKTRDGVDVYARMFTPEMVGAKRDAAAPAVVFVHGAGYLQNAHKYWSSYYREYMFHNLLASRGYVVLDPDYRASAGYGRDWRRRFTATWARIWKTSSTARNSGREAEVNLGDGVWRGATAVSSR